MAESRKSKRIRRCWPVTLVSFNNDPWLFDDSIEYGDSNEFKVYFMDGEHNIRLLHDAMWSAQLYQGGVAQELEFPSVGQFSPGFGTSARIRISACAL